MKHILFAFIAACLFTVTSMPANAARVDILPRKIVLDDRGRSADITIFNLGDKPNFVRLSIIHYRQKSDGTYEELKTPLSAAFNPETGVRFSPKQFTLPAGGRQKIRLAIQKPADLPDGEYRFHVRAISFDEEDSSVRRQKLDKGSSLSLKMNLAVAIPVVFRKGQLTSGAKIENVTTVPKESGVQGFGSLKFDIVRTGKAGVMGTIRAFQQPVGGGEPVEVGISSNLNVFSEVERRTTEMPLRQALNGGPVRLVYTNDFGDKGVFDEVILEK